MSKSLRSCVNQVSVADARLRNKTFGLGFWAAVDSKKNLELTLSAIKEQKERSAKSAE